MKVREEEKNERGREYKTGLINKERNESAGNNNFFTPVMGWLRLARYSPPKSKRSLSSFFPCLVQKKKMVQKKLQ